MPEWNLVSNTRCNRCVVLMLAIATIVSLQLGCSKLRQSALSGNLLDGKRQPSWNSDSGDFDRRFATDADRSFDRPPTQMDSARLATNAVNDSGAQPIELVARPSESTSADGSTDPACDHPAGCDCQKPKMKPKLPFAEPVEPPSHIAITPPPSGLISQPLAPIMFDPETRQIQAKVDTDNNLPRLAETWPLENEANLQKPDAPTTPMTAQLASVETEINPIRLNSAIERKPIRNYDWSDAPQTDISDLTAQAISKCPCDSPTCDGSCKTQSRRISDSGTFPRLTLDESPDSEESIPPYAECPPEGAPVIEGQFIEDVRELEIVVPKTETPVPYAATNDFENVDDADEDEWLEAFGPAPNIPQNCSECESGQCQDPVCQDDLADFEPETESGFAGDFQPMEQSRFQAAPIAVTSAKNENETNFAPASHTVEIPNIEGVTIELPELAFTEVTSVRVVDESGETVNFELPDVVATESDTATKPAETQPVSTGVRGDVDAAVIENAIAWNVKLAETIGNVKQQIANEADGPAKNGLKINLRLLEIVERQMAAMEDRLKDTHNSEPLDFGVKLSVVSQILQAKPEGSDFQRHYDAIAKICELTPAEFQADSKSALQIDNGEFCTEVSGFGQFKPFANSTFRSGQQLLVYCEVENYTSEETALNLETRFLTRLRGSYAVYDHQGRAVQQAEYPIVEDVARNQRRDFYMHYPIQLKDLNPGQYTLVLLVEDMNGYQISTLTPGLSFEVE